MASQQFVKKIKLLYVYYAEKFSFCKLNYYKYSRKHLLFLCMHFVLIYFDE